MDFSSATSFRDLDAFLKASTIKEDGVTVPSLERFVIARGELASADQLSLTQVLLTCAAAVEAGSREDRPDLGRVLLASQGGGGSADPGSLDSSGKRALLQATSDCGAAPTTEDSSPWAGG